MLKPISVIGDTVYKVNGNGKISTTKDMTFLGSSILNKIPYDTDIVLHIRNELYLIHLDSNKKDNIYTECKTCNKVRKFVTPTGRSVTVFIEKLGEFANNNTLNCVKLIIRDKEYYVQFLANLECKIQLKNDVKYYEVENDKIAEVSKTYIEDRYIPEKLEENTEENECSATVIEDNLVINKDINIETKHDIQSDKINDTSSENDSIDMGKKPLDDGISDTEDLKTSTTQSSEIPEDLHLKNIENILKNMSKDTEESDITSKEKKDSKELAEEAIKHIESQERLAKEAEDAETENLLNKENLANEYNDIISLACDWDRITIPVGVFKKFGWVILKVLETNMDVSERIELGKFKLLSKEVYIVALAKIDEKSNLCSIQILHKSTNNQFKSIDDILSNYYKWKLDRKYLSL